MKTVEKAGAWDAEAYDGRHSFVWKLADHLLAMLAPQPGERILDVGSGTGHLTARIAGAGATVVGIDSSPDMVEEARRHYPDIDFRCADIRTFVTSEPFDAVFSNATLHWVGEPKLTAFRIREALRPGGRFVAEFGAKGNIHSITNAATEALEAVGAPPRNGRNLWYFPDEAEYRTILNKAGFAVDVVRTTDRPTELDDSESGMKNWLTVFGRHYFEDLSPEQASKFIEMVEASLRPTLFQDGRWTADYRRILVAAYRPAIQQQF